MPSSSNPTPSDSATTRKPHRTKLKLLVISLVVAMRPKTGSGMMATMCHRPDVLTTSLMQQIELPIFRYRLPAVGKSWLRGAVGCRSSSDL